MSSKTLVKTKLGGIQGKLVKSSDGKLYLAFHNIPYAKTPTGNLRFKAPQPVDPWFDVLDATMEGDECYSKHQFYLNKVGSEDCLKLNVYLRPTQTKQSVMVFIHGGGFVMGSSKVEMYGPDYFMQEDVVLVTINYRLGIFGFLALEDKSLGIPGNAGLKDQIMALKWIQNNISCFGGDPDNVTIFGSSAGSASINYMLCSPMAKGLFHKVIMQSGSALNPWARGRGLPDEILSHFKLKGKTQREIFDKLMDCTKEELLDAQCQCKNARGACDMEPFGPVIEGPNSFEPSFLMEDPLEVMCLGNFIKVPMIIGYTSHEGLLFDAMEVKYNVELSVKDFCYTIPWFYNLMDKKEQVDEISAKIRNFYFGKNDPALRDNRRQYIDMQTDIFFLRGIYVMLKTTLQFNSCAIYLYRFVFDGNLNGYKHIFNVRSQGACHCDDIFYMFKTTLLPNLEPNSIELNTITRIVKMWTQYSKTSNPNIPAYANNIIWPPTASNQLLEIGNELQIKDFPELSRMNFWDELDLLASNYDKVPNDMCTL